MKKTNEEILKRAICLFCVSHAASLEHPNVDIKNLPTIKMRNEQRQHIYDWLKDYGYEDDLTEKEKNILQKEITNEPDWTVYNYFYCYESIEPLLWSISFYENLTAYHQMSSKAFHEILNTVENHNLEKLIKKAKQKNKTKVQEKREVSMLWHWRTRIRGNINVKESVREIFPDLIGIMDENFAIQNEDFLIQNKQYKELEEEKKQLIEQISFWRHYAFEWLLGDESWNEVTTTT